jgi:hypothetical protein
VDEAGRQDVNNNEILCCKRVEEIKFPAMYVIEKGVYIEEFSIRSLNL